MDCSAASRALAIGALALLAALFLGRQLFFGLSLIPFDLLPGTTPWAQHRAERPPPVQNPLLDSLQQYYPRRVTFNESLRDGRLPLWNPHVYGGIPFLATQQSAVLYPPAWLLALIPAEVSFAWSALFHLVVAGAGTFLLLELLGLRRAAAVTGGIAFAFGGFMVVWLAYPNVSQWTWAWLPAILFTWQKAVGAGSGRARGSAWLAATALLFGIQFLGGHAQISAYVVLAFAAYVIAGMAGRPASRAAGRAVAGLAVLLLGAGLAAGHLLPAWEYVPQTDRGERVPWESLAGNAFPPEQMVTFLVPRFFGDGTLEFGYSYWGRLAFVEMTGYAGVVTLVFAAAGLGAAFGRGRGQAAGEELAARRRLTLYFAAIALLGLLLAMRSPLYWVFWRFLPGFGQFTAVARAVCLVGWGVAGLAALGVDSLLRAAEGQGRPQRLGPAARGGVAGALALGVALLAVLTWEALQASPERGLSLFHPEVWPLLAPKVGLAFLWLGLAAALAVAAGRGAVSGARAGLLAAGLVAADLFAFGATFNPATDPSLARRRTPEIAALASVGDPYRFYSYGRPSAPAPFRDRMSPNLPSVYGIPDLHGSDSFFPRRYLATMAAIDPEAIQAGFAHPGLPAFAALGARYFLRPGEPPPGFHPVIGALSENPAALPYARVHTRLWSFDSAGELLQALARADPADALVLREHLPDGLAGARAGSSTAQAGAGITRAAAQRQGPNRMLVNATAPRAGLLVVAEGYNAGWRATVDGRPAPVIPANHMLLAVPLPAGEHRIELRYEPASVRAGLFLTLLSLALLIAIAGSAVGRRVRRSSS